VRIAVDARSLTTQPTGVGHYLLAAVNVWSQLTPEIRFTLLAHKPLHAAVPALLASRDNIHYQCCPAPRLADNGLWWLATHFEPAARTAGADVLWGASGLLPPLSAPGTTSPRRLLTVHDLAYRSLPWTLSRRNRIAYGLLAGRSIRTAATLWAVSEHTASEVRRHYPRRRTAAIVVGSGLNPLRAAASPSAAALEAVRTRHRIGARTLLFVGTLEPRKNLRHLLTLMPALAQRGYRLLVVGCGGWGDSGVADVVQRGDFPRDAVAFCDYVDEAELRALYRLATVFVSPSLLEGFGLPLLEAMDAGCPVVAAANSAMPQVVGEGGMVVAGWNPADWIDAIDAVAAEPDRWRVRAMTRAVAATEQLPKACLAVQAALQAQGGSLST
jgi:glycosyltransferase involved in cell wall biosynthesis